MYIVRPVPTEAQNPRIWLSNVAPKKRNLGFDPAHLTINEKRFQDCDWAEFYQDASEVIPWKKQVPRANFMSTQCFVDANHAGDTKTIWSHTGIMLFCDKMPII